LDKEAHGECIEVQIFRQSAKKEGAMEIEDYCRNVQEELTGWKAKVYDVMRRLDRADTGDKGNIVSQVNDLHIIVEELDQRISDLEKECPTEWQLDREEIQNKLQTLGYKWEEAWENAVGGNVGG
jgi:rubrerythrin